MPTPTSPTGRLLDDDMPPFAASTTPRPRPTVVPPYPQPQRLAAPIPMSTAAPPLQPAQRACYEALGLALQEGHVFAAVTGPEGSGKTTVLEAVLADRHDRALRCIRISDPDKVPARLAAQIEQVAYAEAGKPENLERHVVLAIDDAHTASPELLGCLARLAAMREPGRRVPQVVLVGRTELWNRLATEELVPLARRLAIRAVLPKLQDEQDPWASLEQEVSQTMSQVRAEAEHLPLSQPGSNQSPLFDRAYNDHLPTPMDEPGLPFDPSSVPPPSDYALFPDPPPRAEGRPRESKRRLLLPLGCLLAGVAAFTFVLSFLDWPGLLDDMPWADSKPALSFKFTPQASAPGYPQMPVWAQAQHAPATPPRGAPPPPAVVTQAAPPAPPVVVATAQPSPEPAPKPSEPVAAAAPPVEAAKPEPAKPEPVKPAELPKPVEAAAQPAPTVAEPSRPAPIVAPATAPEPSQAEPATALAALAAPPLAPPPLSQTAPRSTRATPVALVKPAPLPPAIIGLLLRKGDEQLAIGDVSAARLLFERAAESGNAQGAFRLARTYDINYLPAADAALLANRNEARVWYGRAASLGDREAAIRLKDLNEGR